MDDAWRQKEGTPFPLGCSWVAGDQAYNFALLSTTATAVRLRLFLAADLVNPILPTLSLDPLTNKSENTWHCRVSAADAAAASYYSWAGGFGPKRQKVGAVLAALDPALRDALPYLFGLLSIVEGDDPLAQMDEQVKKRRTLDAI